MKRQFEILNELAKILSNEADCDYQSLYYKGEVNTEEGWMESSFKFNISDKTKSVFLTDAAEERISGLVFELNEIMKKQTGGCWKWMTLSIDEKGEAKVHYEY